MKDMPSDMPEGLIFAPSPKREDPRDVLITPHKIDDIADLPSSPIIATGSKRRACQMKQLIEDVTIVGIRGNVDTRIRKMTEENLDGIILAAAGVNRLGLVSNKDYTILPLSVTQMIPAPSQGILALQIKESRDDLYTILSGISDPKTVLQAEAERCFLKEVNGGCHIPVGAYLEVEECGITFHGLFGNEDGSQISKHIKTYDNLSNASSAKAISLAKEVAKAVMKEVLG